MKPVDETGSYVKTWHAQKLEVINKAQRNKSSLQSCWAKASKEQITSWGGAGFYDILYQGLALFSMSNTIQ